MKFIETNNINQYRKFGRDDLHNYIVVVFVYLLAINLDTIYYGHHNWSTNKSAVLWTLFSIDFGKDLVTLQFFQ